jgi:signal transduction histidine kinase
MMGPAFCRGVIWAALVLCALGLWVPLAQALTLDNDSTRVPLAGHLSVLHDPSGRLTFEEVAGPAGQGALKPLRGNVSLGYVPGHVWLRFEVSRTSDAPAQWWLEVPNPLIDEAVLFVPAHGANGASPGYLRLRAGEQVPKAAHDSAPNRQTLFALELPDAQPQTLYLRLSSVNAMVTQPTLWSRQAFASASSREDLFFGGLFALLVVITFTGFLVGGTVRDKGILASTGFNVSLLMILLPNEGYLQLYFFPDYPRLPDIFIGLGLALNFIVGWEILVWLGGLRDEAPRLAQNMRWPIYAIAIPVAIASILGHYGSVAPFMQMFGHIEGGLVIIISLVLAIRGNRDARIFIYPYVTYVVLSISRLGRNVGWLPANAFTEHGFHVAVVIQSVSLAAIAVYRIHRLRAEREAAQARELLVSRRNESELEQRVQERTAELQRSMEDQRQLLSMVAHEFRNPLAVVDGAAQNIARGVGGGVSVQQIRRAVDRMSQLLVNVLAEDKLTEDLRHIDRRPVDLVGLAADCVEFHGANSSVRIRLAAPDTQALVIGDQYLLRILLDNLIDNARKYAANQPVEVVIEAAAQATGGAAGSWLLAVRDRGPGVPEDIDIFGKYVRGPAPAATPGAGLGLFLVARIAALHGGSTTALRRPDGGSQIGVLLPSAPE